MKAAVPLGLCLLPSFVLIGIVPLVAGLLAVPVAVSSTAAQPSTAACRPDPVAPQPAAARSRRRRAAIRAECRQAASAAATRDGGASMHRPTHDERGITTAEYAVGTAAGAGLAGLLFKLLTGGFGEQLLRTLFDHVLSLLGIG